MNTHKWMELITLFPWLLYGHVNPGPGVAGDRGLDWARNMCRVQ